MDVGQTLMSNTISGVVDTVAVSCEVASDKERTLLKKESETSYEGLGESSVEKIGFMSLVEPEPRKIVEGEDRKVSTDGETEPKRFLSVASFSVKNVTISERASFYETDPDESADNLEYFPKNQGQRKTTSGFSGDDEESCGEEEPCWSPPATSNDEHKRTNVDVKKLEDTSLDGPKSSAGDIEVQVHHDSIEDSTSNDDVERLNVSKNSDESFSEIQGVSDYVKTSPGSSFEKQDPRGDVNSETVSQPTRISWTTRLIQKLTEEENKKKLRTEENLKQARKIRIPLKRSAIYERTDKSSPWLQRPNKNPVPPVPIRSENTRLVDRTDSCVVQVAPREKSLKDSGVSAEDGSQSDLQNDPNTIIGSANHKINKDRYAEIINELVLGEENKFTNIDNQDKSTERHAPKTNQEQGVYKHTAIEVHRDKLDEITPLKGVSRAKPSPPNSEPKLSPHSSTTNTKRSPQSDSSSDISVSPARLPFIETAFLSNSPTRNLQDTEEDLMFRKIESKFSSGPGVFRRQKAISIEESKPKISPKPDFKTSLPTHKRTVGSSTTKPSPQVSPNGHEHFNPVYANDVFFRKKRQQAGLLYSAEVERGAQIYEDTPKRESESKVNGRKIGYQVSPSSKETEYQPKGKTVAVAQINSNSVEYHKATQFEANHNNVRSLNNEQDFALQTNSKFNEYVKDYKDYHPSNRSSSSSTSTIVSEAPWNPDSVDLEKAAISGSPEIRKLQLKQRPDYERAQNADYNNRNTVERNLFLHHSEEQRLRSQLPLKIQTDDFVLEQEYQSGRSGRSSAPPVPYYEYSRRLKSPEPVKTYAPLHSSPKQTTQESPRSENYEPVPQQRNLQNISGPKSQKYYSLDSENQRPGAYSQLRNEAGQLLVPVGAQMKITSARGDVLRSGLIQGQEPQRASGIPAHQKRSPRSNEVLVKLSPNLTQQQQEEIYYERMQKARSLPVQQNQSPRSSEVPVKLSPSQLQKQQEEIYYERMQKARSLPVQQKQSPRSSELPVKLSPSLLQKQQEEIYYERMQKARNLPVQQNQSPRSSEMPVKLSPSLLQKQQEEIYYERMQKARSLPVQPHQSPRSSELPVKLSPSLTQKQEEEIYYERMQKTRSLPVQQKQSPKSREPNISQKQEEQLYLERMQKTRSLPQQNANATRGIPNPNSNLNRSFSPTANYRKLSRQEVEQLYWQTQQMRELHAAQLSPRSAQIYMDQYHSTGSLKLPNTLQSPRRLNEIQSLDIQSVPNLKATPLMANQRLTNLKATPLVQSVPNLNRGSPQLVYYTDSRGVVCKPEPIYNSQQYNNQALVMNRQMYLQNMNDGRIRSRSVSPGPNNKYYMNQSPRGVVQHGGSPQQSPLARNLPEQGNFVRGTPQRNTIGAIRSSQPQTLQSTTIYENTLGVYGPEVQLRHPEKMRNEASSSSKIPNGNVKPEKSKAETSKKTKEEKKKEKKSKDKEKEKEKVEQFYPPIFKRGSLSVSNSSVDGSVNESPSAPKRVSFSSGQDSTGFSPEQVYWPTRNGLAPEPPTRQHKQRPDSESDVFLPDSPAGQYYQKGDYIYMNVDHRPVYGMSYDAPDRPLPPLPVHANSPYGSINKSREIKSPTSDSSRKSDGVQRASDFERPAVQAVRGSTASAPQPDGKLPASVNRWQPISESESGSEAGEVQRILQQGNRNVTYFRFAEEEWGADGKPRGPPGSDQSGSSGGGRDDEVRRSAGARGSRRDEPRRHTLSGDHHHQGGALARSMDLEMSSKQRRKSPLPRGYPPPSSAMLFDDDPGIMSEVETSSTGFRRGGKQRSSLPVVRTPSKTLERPLGKGMMGHPQQVMHHPHPLHQQQQHSGGLVFLQYRNETKRALLPNEITSLDTVRALFVRSFPKQLSMEYMDSHHVKIYIHDSSKDMFYELEDLRSHLRDIRDRSVLRLFESADVNGGVLPGAGVGVAPPIWDQDQSYFSEPEFDSEYQHQHIHKSKTSSKSSGAQPYYMTHSYPPGGAGASATLPRGGSLLRTYSPAVPPPLPADRIKTLPQTGVGPPPKPVRTYHQAQGLVARGNQPIYGSFVNCADRRDQSSIYASPDRLHGESGYMSSPERGGPRGSYPPGYLPSGPGSYEDPYYSQYAPRSGSITPVIDEEARASLSRIRVEHMERQLANLTGLVQKALTHTPTPREYLQVPVPSSRDANNYRNDEVYLRTDTKPPKLGKDKSVSFEKSVSFSDEPPDMNSPKQHSPQHAERNDRDRHKPAPPPKPVSLSPAQYEGRHIYRDLQMTPELYNQLRGLQKKAKDLRTEVRNLRRMSQAQAHSVRETIRDTFIKIRAVLVAGGADAWTSTGDHDKLRLTREEDLYKQEMLRLETDLTELESTVEELRGNVINRKTRVNMSDVENMALILSKSSKTVADLKVRFPGLQDGMKGLITSEMEKVVREEKFLNEEPERLESALRRCKKLTGTLVTLKRLASVQEQRLPPSSTPESRLSPTLGDSDSTPPITPPAHGKAGAVSTRGVLAPALSTDSLSRQRPENALDALLDELQTFARPPSNPSLADIGRKGSVDSQHPPSTGGTLRRLHSYPSSSDGGGSSPPTLSRLQVTASPKPPVPERNAELLAQLAGRRQPPPPPPRTSSRSPLASPTSPSLPPRGTTGQPQMGVSGTLRRGAPGRSSLREPLRTGSLSEARPTEETTNPGFNPLSASNSSSCESVNSQEGLQPKSGKQRQEVLEQRHQELLRKQKALQEQYARLQQLQRGAGSLSVPQPDLLLLKKTGSESNLLAKMGLGHSLSAAAPISGSLTHLAVASSQPITSLPPLASMKLQTAPTSTTTTNKIYETDIL